ncbi:MAG TPA: hypothetical protein VG963_20540 [Polyangiaceae bacterium]|nr:hypothetical protein [Polyangiaceae bacterium]
MSHSRSRYAWRPLLLEAGAAHRSGQVSYAPDGTVRFCHSELREPALVPTEHQYPLVFPTLLALDKALSNSSNSPRLRNGSTLREAFDGEYRRYLSLAKELGETTPTWEPDYGTYVYDRRTQDLYLVAPEFWHRLALLTSNAKLLTDPEGKLTAEEIRERLSGTVIGFVGASLGSNVIEGVVREMRPRVAKLADPDYLEATNLNRLQHGSIRYLSQPRSARKRPRNGFETRFVSKVDFVAYENQLVDPYMDWYLYPEGVRSENLDEFLLGSGDEPRLDYVVEEADDFRIKIAVRERARTHGIPVFMASDLGHQSQAQLQDFARNPSAPIGFRVSDADIHQRLERLMSTGERSALFDLARALVGNDFAIDEYKCWIEQTGEQPTNSAPQSGSVAQLSGALGGKFIALHRLGHQARERVLIDLRRLHMQVD